MKVAISGKGGVGKTTIMALLAKYYMNTGHEVLVIDADPSPHMAQTLGFKHIEKITPIAEMRDLLVERSGKVEGSPFYNINPQVDDLLKRYMLEEDGLKLMVLGAIESGNSGCACPENTVLKRLLTKLLLQPSQVVLLDMEAGVEHLGRGTIAGVDHLLVVVIPSKSSVRTAMKIKRLADEVGIKKVSFVGNRLMDPEDKNFLTAALGEEPIAFVPDSRPIVQAERSGLPITGALREVEEAIASIAEGIGRQG